MSAEKLSNTLRWIAPAVFRNAPTAHCIIALEPYGGSSTIGASKPSRGSRERRRSAQLRTNHKAQERVGYVRNIVVIVSELGLRYKKELLR